jgi:hypothetical protein
MSFAKVSSDEIEGAEFFDLELMKDEVFEYGLAMEPGIATITYYNGGDYKAVGAALHAQLTLIVNANPWLSGRLVKNKEGKVVLRHPVKPTENDINCLFAVIGCDDDDKNTFKLKPNSSYNDSCSSMYKSDKAVIVSSGNESIDKIDKPVTLLTVVESVPGKFAIIYSLSHTVGDGHTYYEIFKMLQPGSSVRELQVTRVQTFSDAMKDVCGRKELEWGESMGTGCLFVWSAMLPTALGCLKGSQCNAFYVDHDKITIAKEEAAAAASSVSGDGDGITYVSTNDILTSSFFNACNTRVGWMGLNCRGRIDGISEELAGNYVSALTMDSSAFATPTAVRKMLSKQPFQTVERPLPSCCGWFCGRDSSNFAMVTNWSTFAGDLIKFDNCDLDIHLPLQNPDNLPFDIMIPFMSGNCEKGKKPRVGVICWTVNTNEENLLKILPVTESINLTR